MHTHNKALFHGHGDQRGILQSVQAMFSEKKVGYKLRGLLNFKVHLLPPFAHVASVSVFAFDLLITLLQFELCFYCLLV